MSETRNLNTNENASAASLRGKLQKFAMEPQMSLILKDIHLKMEPKKPKKIPSNYPKSAYKTTLSAAVRPSVGPGKIKNFQTKPNVDFY